MDAIQDLVLTFCPKMRCVSQRKLKLLMPVFSNGDSFILSGFLRKK